MIDRAHDLPITKQAEALNISLAASTICRGRCRKPTLRSCGVSTDCIWSCPSPTSQMLRRDFSRAVPETFGRPYCPAAAKLPVPNTMTFAPIGVRL